MVGESRIRPEDSCAALRVIAMFNRTVGGMDDAGSMRFQYMFEELRG